MTTPQMRTALEWFVRLRDEQTTQADQSEFAQWLGADPANADAFAQAEQVWQRFVPVSEELGRVRRKTFGRRAFMAWSVALLGGWWATRPGRFADEATGTGQTRLLTLEDGSTIRLAPRTAVSADQRSATLHTGEAHFTIAGASSAFVVQAGGGEVRSYGGRFNLALAPAFSRLTVVEAAAEVHVGGSNVAVAAGTELTFDHAVIGTPKPADPSRLAWLEGRLVFQATALSEVLDQIARYSGQRFVFLDSDLRSIPVTSAFDVSRIDGATRALASALPVRFRSVAGFTLVS